MAENYDLMRNLETCNTEFALDLYRMIDEKDNIFFSPASINLGLAMTRLGAENRTHEQLTKGLHLNLMEKEEYIRSAYGRMVEALNKQKKCKMTKTIELSLRTANRMYVDQTYRITDEIKQELKQIFKTEVGEVDFINNAAKSAEEINKWIEEYTNSKIKDIVDPKTITRDEVVIILVNAVYFKGTWQLQFIEDQTKPMDFHISPTSSKKVDMMYRKNLRVSYTQSAELDCKVLVLPYRPDELGMMILLPNQIDGIDKMVSKLNAQMIDNLSKGTNIELVTVQLPKFKLETTYDLKSALTKLGMEDLFSLQDADLSTFTGKKELYVTGVVHKTFLDVDEKGTEAAAATLVMLGGGPGFIDKEIEFTADHPFVFLIRDSMTGLVIFMGCYRNPVTK